MFLHLSVILFTGGGGVWQTVPEVNRFEQASSDDCKVSLAREGVRVWRSHVFGGGG